jgi:hypothetical protein
MISIPPVDAIALSHIMLPVFFSLRWTDQNEVCVFFLDVSRSRLIGVGRNKRRPKGYDGNGKEEERRTFHPGKRRIPEALLGKLKVGIRSKDLRAAVSLMSLTCLTLLLGL